MRVLFKNFYLFLIFLFARFISLFLYNRKYMKSKWFKGNKYFFDAPGWIWVIRDFCGRIFLNVNSSVPFPISPFCKVIDFKNIDFSPDSLNCFQTPGTYFQAYKDGKIIIGKNVWIAPNVGIVSSNHDPLNPSKHQKGETVIIEDNCWIGMNSIILPGVKLGKNTVVGAGSVVTKSFPEGFCVIAGNPAKKIKDLQKEDYTTS